MGGSGVPMVVDHCIGASTVPTDDNNFRDLVREVYDEYITNEVPIHLLHITGGGQETHFELVDRTFVKDHFKFIPGEIYGELRSVRLVDREGAIKARVKEKLRYAIFSHRWLSQEPTYQDISKEPMKVRAEVEDGWKKLREFCRRTKDDHDCEFAWSDICCIDKTSSAELDESIRSMFRWYRNSYICIAHLSETADLAALRKQEESGAEVDIWFKRGWTLQELLAPSRIKFYDVDWIPLIPLHHSKNDRIGDTIMSMISNITHIPLKDLQSFKPGTNRVPEKMLWASKRRTTRIEDIAYCLIGIFDVSLMIAYGEGNRAFFRLMEEIMRRYDKWDMFLWSGRCSHYNVALPYAPHCYPVGYTEALVKRRHEADSEEEMNTAMCEIGDSLFALTNHGLRIKLLLLGVELEDTRDESHDSRCLSFKHADFQVQVRHIGAKREPHTTVWAMGILDYWIDVSGGGFIDGKDEEDSFTAFLLSMDRHAASPRDARWKKEMTENVIKIEPNGYVGRSLTQLYL